MTEKDNKEKKYFCKQFMMPVELIDDSKIEGYCSKRCDKCGNKEDLIGKYNPEHFQTAFRDSDNSRAESAV